jgi:hypothetical protein
MRHERGLIYAPACVVNADLGPKEDAWRPNEEILEACKRIYAVLTEIFHQSQARGRAPHVIADEIARDRFARRH